MTDDTLHDRFIEWLVGGASGEPPRDLAIHAALCPQCARWIAAHDALAAINPSRAALPTSRPAVAALPSSVRTAGRFAATAGAVLLVGGTAAFTAGQVINGNLGPFAHPTGAVLGITGSPEPSPSVGLPAPTATPTPAPTAAST